MIEKDDFYNLETFDIYNGKRSKKALKTLPDNLWVIAYRKFTFLNRADKLEQLRIPPNNRLEALKGERKGQYSIRINDKYRMCFEWYKDHPARIEIVDYH
ncbi:MAG: type II toxin-antitoxin system RelE/ParE family toxin [Candidatus Omnitrophica bacterium]|nr:type II toxin-antitoxin system RelE/ParE family toxin [Candidatus Omnitrophota bacterium]